MHARSSIHLAALTLALGLLLNVHVSVLGFLDYECGPGEDDLIDFTCVVEVHSKCRPVLAKCCDKVNDGGVCSYSCCPDTEAIILIIALPIFGAIGFLIFLCFFYRCGVFQYRKAYLNVPAQAQAQQLNAPPISWMHTPLPSYPSSSSVQVHVVQYPVYPGAAQQFNPIQSDSSYTYKNNNVVSMISY